jgi:hypothetical protein
MTNCLTCRWANTCHVFTGKGEQECFALHVQDMQEEAQQEANQE